MHIALSDYQGKWLVLFFYPLDFTFVCPTEIIEFSERAKEFKNLGCDVIGCSVDSKHSHLAWVNQPRKEGGLGEMKIPLLSDITKEISNAYGVLVDEGTDKGLSLRGTFIIDPKQIVRHISINDLGVGRSIDETLRLVEAFQFNDKHEGAKTMIADPVQSKEYFKALTMNINALVEQTPKTRLVPRAFFVAWRGVLTLAFTGFPASLVALKQNIDASIGSILHPENSGSKWPKARVPETKMTLAALKDDAKPLTAEELEKLQQLCGQLSTNLLLLQDDFPVTRISYVRFACRSLERVVFRADIELLQRVEEADEVSGESCSVVDAVLGEYEKDKVKYLEEVQKSGNRESHYRENHVESTLAIVFGESTDVQMILDEFRRAVDFLLPGYYAWMEGAALHSTLRNFLPMPAAAHAEANMQNARTDPEKWRLEVERGRQIWHYLGDNPEKLESWPMSDADRYWQGLPLKNPQVFPKAETPFDAAVNGYRFFQKLQTEDGHWAGEYGGPMFLIPGFVITMYITKTPWKPGQATELINYLRARANKDDGGWGIHIESQSTVFGTALNYVALRLLGVHQDDPVCTKARSHLHKLGGAVGSPAWGKFWLSVLNVYEWEGNNPLPAELW
ncbi:Lanosterol synthase (Oxidosqualene--lanosterol cyclase) [Entophlyctis luteolus]|nr:Lanosterol synthase (Oxidosqualene--lanosterol cyclase) [Entophlyctis luteolus]